MRTSLAALVGGAVSWPSGPSNASLKRLTNLSPEDIHVLLVDDERLSRVVVGNLLRKCNYRVTSAGSGQEALEILRSSDPGTFQLVLTDVMMPDVDGIELLRYLRRNESFAAVPVVMMSANEHTDTVFECIRGGAEDYLLKPVTKKEVQYIWQHVWRRQQQNAMSVPNIHEEEEEVGVPQQGGAAPSVPSASIAMLQQPPFARDGIQPLAIAAQPPLTAQLEAMPTAQPPAQPAGVPPPQPTGLPASLRLPAPLALPATAGVSVADSERQPAARLPPVDRHRSGTHSATLAEYFARRKGMIHPDDCFRIFCQVLGLLQKCHSRGFALGRVCPTQLRVTATGAVFTDSAPVPPEEFSLYAAPEVLPPAPQPSAAGVSAAATAGGASAPADVYSLGVLFFELFHPVAGGAAERLRTLRDLRHQLMPAQLLQERPREAAFLQTLLQPEPSARPSVDALLKSNLLQSLHDSLAGRRPAAAQPATAPATKQLPVQRGGAAQQPAPTAAATQSAPRSAAPQVQQPQQQPASAEHALDKQQKLRDKEPAAAQRKPLVVRQLQQQLVAVLPPSAQALGEAEDKEVLLDFLRLVRRHKLAETQRVGGQLAGAEADLQEARRRLAAVHVGGASAPLTLQQAPLPAVAGAGVLPSPGVAQATAAAEVAAPGGRKRRRNEAWLSGADRDGGAAVLSDALPSDHFATGNSPTSSTAALPCGVMVAAPAQLASDPVPRMQPALQRAAARVSAAFSVVDEVYAARRASCSAQLQAAAPRGGSGLGQPSAVPVASQSAAAAGPIVAGPSNAVAAPGEKRVCVPGMAGDHLMLLGQDLMAFTRYSELKVKATLKYGDLLVAPDMVCSTSFDRDDEYFATAGVSRRIKVFEYAAMLDEGAGIHYPVHEVPSRSKLSCVCWNSYIKSNLIASDYDGAITLHDMGAGVELASFEEHSKRVWSVDFSQTDPTRFLSGSDDGTVRLWSLNDESAVACIDSKANVCSVQFSPVNSNLMAFGSANYRVYLYDLRNIQVPLAVISGHSKAVSYVRFMGGSHVVSASTDDTLKLWDVSRATGGSNTRPDATFRGHINEKNFVGLSVTSDGYIAAGSEDNALYCYHKAMPTPVMRHCFDDPSAAVVPPTPHPDSENPDAHLFISSVTWCRRGGACIAANSQGHIKTLELV